jgi:hypothetical protein
MVRTQLFVAAFAAIAALSVPAWAQERDAPCYDDGYRCVPISRNSEVPWYARWDHSPYDRDRYNNERDRHYVCDPDGDRCYVSHGGRWDYREYYRRYGYRWND